MNNLPSSPRVAKYLIERVSDLVGQLTLAKTFMADLDLDQTGIDAEIESARTYQRRLHAIAQQRIDSRGRFKKKPLLDHSKRPVYYLFLDECGSHVAGPVDRAFPLFCLTGVIVSKENYEQFDSIWRRWKQEMLGNAALVTHEPDLRANTKAFRKHTPEERTELLQSLDDVLDQLDFQCLAAVVDLRELQQMYPGARVDEFLPESCYLMAIDFIMERFVTFLQIEGDAHGQVFAESRGAREDAIVHAEFLRLQLHGTQYRSESDFRYQLLPHMEFYRKSRNHSGLQIADLAARPFAEIVRDPTSSPVRWDVFRKKIYAGKDDIAHSHGMKIFPRTATNDPLKEQKG